ncbi:gluconokinase [Halomonas sp. NyZ770]|uniref:gluconokinase n=1 Tax=Halomonas sp. NyZ770 TaxID=2883106 RepID=UPI001D09F659|nr:gluconokinase, GntK/IdnK-type [Halomonas sp. NyZ770]UDM06327.1 gluconokinase [Halomonas sp. NyZ770]
MTSTSQRILVMGVSGSGKTHIGQQLASSLGATFIDGDDHHSAANVAKMASGTPLNDDDRQAWLATLSALLQSYRTRDASVVVACSGLKRRYRDRLRQGDGDLRILYLKGTPDVLRERLATRAGHFFKGDDMLASQLADLEPPLADEAVTMSIELPPRVIVERFCATLSSQPQRSSS